MEINIFKTDAGLWRATFKGGKKNDVNTVESEHFQGLLKEIGNVGWVDKISNQNG